MIYNPLQPALQSPSPLAHKLYQIKPCSAALFPGSPPRLLGNSQDSFLLLVSYHLSLAITYYTGRHLELELTKPWTRHCITAVTPAVLTPIQMAVAPVSLTPESSHVADDSNAHSSNYATSHIIRSGNTEFTDPC